MRSALLLSGILLTAGWAVAQPVSFGIKGGVPFTEAARFDDESRRYTVGPVVEFRLPAGFAVEAGALYSRVGYTYRFYTGTPGQDPSVRERGNSWEFPFLGKRYFGTRARKWQPFLGTGWSLRTVGYHTEGRSFVPDPSGESKPFDYSADRRSELGVGAVFAAGTRFRSGKFAFSPEVRYTRWGSDNGLLKKNQVGIFLGLTF